jgi:hypothetical protein
VLKYIKAIGDKMKDYEQRMEELKCELADKVFEKYDLEIAEKLEDLIYKGKNDGLSHQDKIKVVSELSDVYRFMPEEDRGNKAIAEVAILQNTNLLLHSPTCIQEDRDFVLNIATNGKISYSDLGKFSDKFRSDPEIVLEIAKKDVEHATNYSINLDEHFKENLNNDKYDTGCINSLTKLVESTKMADKLHKSLQVNKTKSVTPKIKI